MNTAALVLPFTTLSARDLPRVGGKGANLGEMTQAGLPVPPGFCLTTAAFDQTLRGLPGLDAALDALDAIRPDDLPGMRRESEAVRRLIEATPTPPRGRRGPAHRLDRARRPDTRLGRAVERHR